MLICERVDACSPNIATILIVRTVLQLQLIYWCINLLSYRNILNNKKNYCFEPELCKQIKQVLEMHNLSDKLCASIQNNKYDIIHTIKTRLSCYVQQTSLTDDYQ